MKLPNASAKPTRSRVALWLVAAALGLPLPIGCNVSRGRELPGEPGGDDGGVALSLEEALAAGAERDVLVLLGKHGAAEHREEDATDVDARVDEEALDLGQGRAAATRDDGDDSSYVALETREGMYRALAANVLASFSSDEIELKRQYRSFPMLLVRVRSLAALQALAEHDDVAGLFDDRDNEAFLTQSLGLIHQPAVLAGGSAGAGTAVAVLDTGVDFMHPAFGSCSAAGDPGCSVAYAADFAVSDGQRDDTGHGTNVAAIVLGVAPQTKLLALDVFTGKVAYTSNILAAIDWSIQNRATYNIVAINLSLGSRLFSSPCTADVFSAGIASARAAGILPVVAAGNDGSSESIAAPACSPGAVSVGAVYDSSVGGRAFHACTDNSTRVDQVTCFSNSASFLSLLAPGALITAGGLTQAGTSQAAPHVAGAAAVLRAARPSESLDDLVTRLTSQGPSVLDSRNGVSKHRLDLQAALGSARPPDATPPIGSLQIDGGATVTRSRNVMLALAASDDSGVPSVCIANQNQCSDWRPFAASIDWLLTADDGDKTVHVWVKDGAGNILALSKAIAVDTTAPTEPSLSAIPGDRRMALSWSQSIDAGSGLQGYKVVFASDAAPASCASGSLLYSGTANSTAHSALANGATYGYRVCALDRADNLSAGGTALGKAAPELSAPTGSVSINAGAPTSPSRAVTLSLRASDASSVTSVCVSNSRSCSSWKPFAASRSWTLRDGDGPRTVYVWFRDQWSNASAVPVSDSTIVATLRSRRWAR